MQNTKQSLENCFVCITKYLQKPVYGEHIRTAWTHIESIFHSMCCIGNRKDRLPASRSNICNKNFLAASAIPLCHNLYLPVETASVSLFGATAKASTVKKCHFLCYIFSQKIQKKTLQNDKVVSFELLFLTI